MAWDDSTCAWHVFVHVIHMVDHVRHAVAHVHITHVGLWKRTKITVPDSILCHVTKYSWHVTKQMTQY